MVHSLGTGDLVLVSADTFKNMSKWKENIPFPKDSDYAPSLSGTSQTWDTCLGRCPLV